MWSLASSTAIWTAFASDVGTLLATILGAILAAVAGFMIIGYGVRKTSKHVTGRKF